MTRLLLPALLACNETGLNAYEGGYATGTPELPNDALEDVYEACLEVSGDICPGESLVGDESAAEMASACRADIESGLEETIETPLEGGVSFADLRADPARPATVYGGYIRWDELDPTQSQDVKVAFAHVLFTAGNRVETIEDWMANEDNQFAHPPENLGTSAVSCSLQYFASKNDAPGEFFRVALIHAGHYPADLSSEEAKAESEIVVFYEQYEPSSSQNAVLNARLWINGNEYLGSEWDLRFPLNEVEEAAESIDDEAEDMTEGEGFEIVHFNG